MAEAAVLTTLLLNNVELFEISMKVLSKNFAVKQNESKNKTKTKKRTEG